MRRLFFQKRKKIKQMDVSHVYPPPSTDNTLLSEVSCVIHSLLMMNEDDDDVCEVPRKKCYCFQR